ncbi:MAG: hypothetical protein IKK83_04975 [Clostridia bacterium]|nr:hypothetical protein [Clostridia bacterium]
MATISYQEFVKIFNILPFHSEIEFIFSNTKKTYMLIKYEDSISFQRCGNLIETIRKYNLDADFVCSGEVFYKNLEELYIEKSVDGICLQSDWDRIEKICVNNSFNLPEELEEIFNVYCNNP